MSFLHHSVCFFTILFFFASCSDNSDAENHIEEIKQPTDTTIYFSYSVNIERYSYLIVDNDTCKRILSEIEGYDSEHNLIEHIRFSHDGRIEEHIFYLYDEDKLKEEYRIEYFAQEVLYKTTYSYQNDGALESTVTYDFQRRLNPDVHKGMGQPGGCIIVSSDFESLKTWGGKTTTTFSYNENGKLVEKISTSENATERETYSYDSIGNINETRTMNNSQVTRIITATHSKDSTETNCIFVNYNNEGNTGIIKYDATRNVIEEVGISRPGGDTLYRRLYTYDLQNRVSELEYITNLGISIFTEYEYRNLDSPAVKHFLVDNK